MLRPCSFNAQTRLICEFCKKERVLIRVKRDRIQRFCSRKCFTLNRRRPAFYKNGYKLVYLEGHPRADNRGRVREHLLVMEKKIGRPILRSESVHHIDGNKLNNSPDNLMLFSSHKEHLLHHWNEENLRKKNGKRVK